MKERKSLLSRGIVKKNISSTKFRGHIAIEIDLSIHRHSIHHFRYFGLSKKFSFDLFLISLEMQRLRALFWSLHFGGIQSPTGRRN
jgi:hypothetical protein